MAVIGEREIARIYKLSKLIEDGTLTISEAVADLEQNYRMTRGTVRPYLRKLSQLLAGKTYTRTMNQVATRFFLEKILEDYGVSAGHNALAAVKAHLYYYPKGPQPGIAAIAEQFENRLSGLEVTSIESFDAQVSNLMLAAQAGRPLSKPVGNSQPRKSSASVTVISRDPAVAAYVRLAANGLCQRCNAPAPFIRKKDGLPYLEVHHIVRLADKGPDTVENAVALCPNCHREMHFG